MKAMPKKKKLWGKVSSNISTFAARYCLLPSLCPVSSTCYLSLTSHGHFSFCELSLSCIISSRIIVYLYLKLHMHKYVDLINRCFPFIHTVSDTHTYVTSHEYIASQRQLNLKREERRKQASASSLTGMLMVPLLKVSLNRQHVLYSTVLYCAVLYGTLL